MQNSFCPDLWGFHLCRGSDQQNSRTPGGPGWDNGGQTGLHSDFSGMPTEVPVSLLNPSVNLKILARSVGLNHNRS